MLKEQISLKVEPENMKDQQPALVVAENIALAKLLSSNKKKIRDLGMKKLGRWLSATSKDSHVHYVDNFRSIWKGLFYAMWFADKFLIQEEIAEKIGGLILHCEKQCMVVPFIKGFFETMMTEWYGIDQLRYDKYLMLVRRFVRHIFKYCKLNEWNIDFVREISEIFKGTVLCVQRVPPLSLTLHFSEVYLQELAKMSEGNLAEEVVEVFLNPFITYIAQQPKSSARMTVSENIFHYLINQSDVGIEFHEKVKAWKQSHFPGNSWNDMEKVEINSDDALSDIEAPDIESKNEHLDPRAGRLDVELPPINFNAQAIAETLKNEEAVNGKCRAALKKLAREFETLSSGEFPRAEAEALKVICSKNLKKANLEKAAKKLDEFASKFVLKKSTGRAAKRLMNFESRLHKRRAKKRNRKRKTNENRESMPFNTEVTEVLDIPSNIGIKLPVKEADLIAVNTTEETDKCLKMNHIDETKPSVDENIVSKVKELKRKTSIVAEEKTEGMITNKKLRENPLITNVELSPARRKKQSGTPGRRESSGNWEVTEITSTPGIKNVKSVPSSEKKVKIALNKIRAQDVRQYHLAVRNSPQIPYDAAKKPSHGLLKPNLPKGPINPFYKLSKSTLF